MCKPVTEIPVQEKAENNIHEIRHGCTHRQGDDIIRIWPPPHQWVDQPLMSRKWRWEGGRHGYFPIEGGSFLSVVKGGSFTSTFYFPYGYSACDGFISSTLKIFAQIDGSYLRFQELLVLRLGWVDCQDSGCEQRILIACRDR